VNFGLSITLATSLVLLAVGWRNYRSLPERRTHATLLSAFACLLPFLGILSYAPWPAFHDFYGFPYLTGTAILVAFAVSGWAERGAKPAFAAILLTIVPFLFMLTAADRTTKFNRAAINVAHDATRVIARGGASDTVIVAVGTVARREWIGLAALLSRQAVVNGDAFPVLVEFKCEEAKQKLDSGWANRLVAFHSQCPPLGRPHNRIVHRFSWFDWSRGRFTADSVSADVFKTE
jgi:hypothetical protein